MTTKLFQPRYEEGFKRKVIEEYLSTGCSKMSLLRKYDIPFKSAIQTWMRILGYNDVHQGLQMRKFEEPIFISLPKRSNPSTDKISELQQKVRELERQLEDEKLRTEAYIRVIEKAEQELKIPIRKKPNTR